MFFGGANNQESETTNEPEDTSIQDKRNVNYLTSLFKSDK